MHSTLPVVAQRGSSPAPRGVTDTNLLYVRRSTRPLTFKLCFTWKVRTARTVAASNTDVLARLSPVQISRCWTAPTIAPLAPTESVEVNLGGVTGGRTTAAATGLAVTSGAIDGLDEAVGAGVATGLAASPPAPLAPYAALAVTPPAPTSSTSSPAKTACRVRECA